MKRTKRLTKRELKAQKKFLAELAKTQPQPEMVSKSKAQKKTVLLPLSVYLAKQAEKKHAKQHARDDKRAAKADKIANRKAVREAKRLVREAKEARRTARKSKIMSLVEELGK